MNKNKKHPESNISLIDFQKKYNDSITNPEIFWAEQAEKFVSWSKKWEKVLDADFHTGNVSWFSAGELNVCYNCLDRHLAHKKDKVALIWEGDSPEVNKEITYNQLHTQVCKLANVLKSLGIKKGDKICIYLPMIPEVAIAMLAAVRIGAIHTVVFAGFSSEALKNRILDSNAKLIITTDENIRAGKKNVIKSDVDKALEQCPEIIASIIIKTSQNKPQNFYAGRDYWYHELMQNASSYCPVEPMESNEPLFILYTSGSTGKPKGILHTNGGYLVYIATSFYYIFNYQDDDVYWCSADVGWITGHSYLIYAPLAHGATTLMYESTPDYPDYSRYWQIIERYRVTTFYTSPTALRTLKKQGDDFFKNIDLSSLKLLGSVGEPINPEVWLWFYEKIGNSNCPIIDTWWQTETGGIMISPVSHITKSKPGSAAWPFFGVNPAIVDNDGKEITDTSPGRLIIKTAWPGLAKTIYNDDEKFFNNYFKDVPNAYLTGDNAYKDADNYYWITGRTDDVIKVSGHRLSTAELESSFLTHNMVSEAAVVAIPHKIKGYGIYAFISLKNIKTETYDLEIELTRHIRQKIGPIATPEYIQLVSELPKTRSGKIMRRILRKIVENNFDDLKDTSTLTNPECLPGIIQGFLSKTNG